MKLSSVSFFLCFSGCLVLGNGIAQAQPQSAFRMMCLRQNDGSGRTLSRAQAELGTRYRIGGGGADSSMIQYVFQKAGETCYVYTNPSGRVISTSYAPY
jgi:hypothetical protein